MKFYLKSFFVSIASRWGDIYYDLNSVLHYIACPYSKFFFSVFLGFAVLGGDQSAHADYRFMYSLKLF